MDRKAKEEGTKKRTKTEKKITKRKSCKIHSTTAHDSSVYELKLYSFWVCVPLLLTITASDFLIPVTGIISYNHVSFFNLVFKFVPVLYLLRLFLLFGICFVRTLDVNFIFKKF